MAKCYKPRLLSLESTKLQARESGHAAAVPITPLVIRSENNRRDVRRDNTDKSLIARLVRNGDTVIRVRCE
ncbi:hypothetical protein HUJ05_005735 [Dendroctonus ponderosae]|nr:hypothetical protein HUJ05_005735 [Dendroctonus ponderosae]